MHACYFSFPWYVVYYEYFVVAMAIFSIVGIYEITLRAIDQLGIEFVHLALIIVIPYLMLFFVMDVSKKKKTRLLEEALRSLLENDRKFQECNFNNERITARQCQQIANALERNTNLAILELGWNRLRKEDCVKLANALKANRSVTQLMLGFNRIGDGGCEALAAALEDDNKTLIDLNLASNDIGFIGACALSQTLLSNKSLLRLDLSYNLIRAEGIQALAEAIAVNQTLTSLDLKYTGIVCKGCEALASALKINKSITHLSLESNKIGDTGCTALANAFKNKKNSTLYDLNLSENDIGIDGFQAWLRVLENENVTLTNLDLRFNYHSDTNRYLVIRRIDFYLKLNISGRRKMCLLYGENTREEEKLVAETLVKVSPSKKDMDLFFYFLLSRPELCNRNLDQYPQLDKWTHNKRHL